MKTRSLLDRLASKKRLVLSASSLLVATACGGGGVGGLQMPTVPGADGGPAFTVQIGNTSTLNDSSKALVKLDPTSKYLVIVTATSNVTQLTCDTITTPSKLDTSDSSEGSATFLYAKAVDSHAAGKYAIYFAREAKVVPSVAHEAPGAPSEAAIVAVVDVKQFDDKGFKGDYSSESTGANGLQPLTGNVVGTVCPDGAIDAPAEATPAAAAPADADAGAPTTTTDSDAKPAKKGGKKKKK